MCSTVQPPLFSFRSIKVDLRKPTVSVGRVAFNQVVLTRSSTKSIQFIAILRRKAPFMINFAL